MRIDKKRSFLLYGDFVTGNGFATQGQAQVDVPDSRLVLGAYIERSPAPRAITRPARRSSTAS